MIKKIILILLIGGLVINEGILKAGELTDSGMELTGVCKSAVAWGDYDNDNDLDLVLIGNKGGLHVISKIYKNENGILTEDTLQELLGKGWGDAVWGDYDKDGDLDLALSGAFGNIKIYQNDNGILIEDHSQNLPAVYDGILAWVDYDNDGDLDLAMTGRIPPQQYISKIYRNDDGSLVEDTLQSLPGVWESSLAWGDYDNDGDLDLVLIGQSGPTGDALSKVYRNDDGILNEDTNQSIPAVTTGFLAWGDYDNDGDLDLVLTGRSESTYNVSRVYQNDYGILKEKQDLHESWGMLHSSVAWGDYDNDGDLDLAMMGYYFPSGKAAMIYRNDNGFFNLKQGLTGVDNGDIGWADIDNDHDLDLVLTGSHNGGAISKVYLNNESDLDGYNNPNTSPLPPTSGFNVDYKNEVVTLRWGDGSDEETPTSGLYYNIRIGTASGKDNVVPSRYGTPLFGVYYGLKSKTLKLKNLPKGTYYWSVQTIDTSLAPGTWSVEQQFTIGSFISITPVEGTIGTIINISGKGFDENEIIRIDFGTTQTITTVSTNAGGTFTTVFTINTQPYGMTTVKATGLISGKTASNSFQILPKILFITPSMGTVGTAVTIAGNGFGASEGIHILFGTTVTIGATVSDKTGKFDTTFIVDTQPFGTTTIRVRGVHSQAESPTYFFILPNIILLTPTFGTVGSRVTIAGNGFGSLENIRVDFGTTISICNVMSNTCGTFSAVFTVNVQPYGTTSIIATGFPSMASARNLFKIVPNIQVLPTSGQVGSVVTVTGNGFGATESVRIAFGTTHTIALTSTNAVGEFAVVFTVNSQPIGTTTIVAYGLGTNIYAMGYFVILPFTTLKIIPPLQNIAIGEEFTCQVEIKDVRRMITAKLHLIFNHNILELQEIGTGTFPQDGMVAKRYDNTNGKIDYFVGLLSGSATGSGILCTLKFKAKAGGTSAIVFDNDEARLTRLKDADTNNIPFNKEEALYRIITGIDIKPKDKIIKADESINYQCIAYCGGLELEVSGSTTFTSNGGGSFTLNTFHAKYMGTYTITGEYLGFIGTTSVIILPGTPTTLIYVSGNNQVNTCTFKLKDPFIVKVVDKYDNPCKDVEVDWEVIEVPTGATGYSISPTKTTTNIQGTASSLLTLGTEPPGTYTIHAISSLLSGSPCIFTAHSLRRFGNIGGFCMLKLGTVTLGTSSDIEVRIVELGTTTTTNDKSYFIFEKIPVGTYTLTFDTWGASPATKTNVCISLTQFEDTTYIGTISLLAGDVNNDGKVNIEDWPGLVDGFFKKEGDSGWEEAKNSDFDHDGWVDDEDFIILRNNFGQQQEKNKAKKLSAMPTRAKKTSGKIELSFGIETLEGVDINELRVGNIIYLKIYIRDAKDYLGGEIHLTFNPKVLQVIDAISENTYKSTALSAKRLTEGIQIQPGDYIPENKRYQLINKVDNEKGKIDYAVGVLEPMDKDEGVLAIVPFKVISCGAYSKVGFEFEEEENRQTMFLERTGKEDKLPEVIPNEITIDVPLVFNNLDSALVYPNPAYKGQEVTFDKLTTDKQVTLRIYNVAGELVVEKEKAKGSSAPIKWNLRNKDNEDVASGIYIYLLKDELGSTKRGKIGVIK